MRHGVTESRLRNPLQPSTVHRQLTVGESKIKRTSSLREDLGVTVTASTSLRLV